LECDSYDFVVPVPLHRVRQRTRGFNQSELLAREVLTAFPNARLDTSLKRIRPTEVLSQLKNEKQRLSSVRGAFDLAVSEHLRGKSVLLIDDVVTTCATVSECALVLKKAGVAYVDVLAATLALPDALRKPADDEYDEIV